MGTDDKIQSTINAILYVLQKLGGRGDFHRIFKVLYFADQKHLTRYGSLINDDKYIAMKNGPVPSMAYDILKALRGEGLLISHKTDFEPYFNLISSYEVESKKEFDVDELSESEIACIDESIEENGRLNFNQLTDKSHDKAWEKSSEDCEMKIDDIADAGGANKEMVQYINEIIENQKAAFQ